MTEREQHQSALDRIVGARLTSVDFVLNYLILGFNEKGAFTLLVWPEVTLAGHGFAFGAEGYRDALCSLIEAVVESVAINGADEITVKFIGGARLFIRLNDRTGGERAILTSPRGGLHVF